MKLSKCLKLGNMSRMMLLTTSGENIMLYQLEFRRLQDSKDEPPPAGAGNLSIAFLIFKGNCGAPCFAKYSNLFLQSVFQICD